MSQQNINQGNREFGKHLPSESVSKSNVRRREVLQDRSQPSATTEPTVVYVKKDSTERSENKEFRTWLDEILPLHLNVNEDYNRKAVYEAKLGDVFTNMFEDLHNRNRGWTFDSRKEDVDVFTRKVDGSDILYVMGKGIVPYPLEQVLTVFTQAPLRAMWDDHFDYGNEIEKVDELTRVEHHVMKGKWPVKGRDFVILGTSRQLRDGSILVACTSVQHPNCPESDEYVRGEIIYLGYHFVPCGQNKQQTDVTYVIGSDPKGHLPNFAAHSVSRKQPMCIAQVRSLLDREPTLGLNTGK